MFRKILMLGEDRRAIKSVKQILALMLYNGLNDLPALKSRIPTEFKFLTIMCEIEAILKSRPITKLSPDVEDWQVLTYPISILTGNLHPDSPGITLTREMCSETTIIK